ncbi:MAG: flagellar hook-associated protein FlgL [Burkholderiales bacterium]|nr:flagellar hook-associated protein FlgL [Burkholderiales bacterium]
MAETSFSRLSTANTYDNALRNIQSRQSALASLQENLTSGKRVVVASDDPTGAAQAERSLTRLSRIATDQRALEAQRNSIAMAESTLGNITDAMQSFRELVVTAGNGTHTAEERKTIALQLNGLREQILGYANRKDTNGMPLFGALASAMTPFVGPQGAAPDYTFAGLPGQRVSTDVTIPFTLDGDSAFMHHSARDGVFNVTTSTIPGSRNLQTSGVQVSNPAQITGSAYTLGISAVDTTTVPGTTTVTYSVTENPSVSGPIAPQTASYPSAQPGTITVTAMPGLTLNLTGTPAVGDTISISPNPSVFSVLDNAIRDIGGAVNANAAAQAVGQALHNIDIGMSRISAVRGQAGDLLNRADRITSNQQTRSIQLEADRSRAEDLDMIKGVSDFQKQQTGYQAALQSYAQVQKLSLFNYIS